MNQLKTPGKTAAIRSEARLHLTRLRQERLAKKRAMRPSPQLDPIVPEAPAEPEDETDVAPVAAPQLDAPSEPDSVLETEPEVDETAEPDGAPDEPVEAEVPETAAEDDVAEVALEASEEQEGSVGELDASVEGSETDSDLGKLPGAGPGLVWMLKSCGVQSMEELASVDADKLKSDMGLVAKLLDVDFWIKFARETRA